jgi:hypothetical protein
MTHKWAGRAAVILLPLMAVACGGYDMPRDSEGKDPAEIHSAEFHTPNETGVSGAAGAGAETSAPEEDSPEYYAKLQAETDAQVAAEFWKPMPSMPDTASLSIPQGMIEQCQPTEVMWATCNVNLRGNEPSRFAFERCVMEMCDKAVAAKHCDSHTESAAHSNGDIISCMGAILSPMSVLRDCEVENGRFDITLAGKSLTSQAIAWIQSCSG